MQHINNQVLHYLIDDQHNGSELSSFSLEKGRESKGTIIANIFRGNQQRCLELIIECEKIYQDKELLDSLTFNELKNLMRNSGNLNEELKGTTNEQKADQVFQEILKMYREHPENPLKGNY
ncbi:MAG TPA: hypothetical protein DCE71_01770 [Parachlamydiales bacterium]|nr:hypothetical protein [Parachlamydiales bacterium]